MTSYSVGLSPCKNILIFSLEDWNEVWRRNQFFCAQLHDRHPDVQILWISPPADLLHDAIRGTATEAKDNINKVITLASHPRIKIFKPLKLMPNVVAIDVNNFYLKWCIEKAIKSLDWKEWTTWINDQKACRYFPGGRERLIYDITDDWTEFEQSNRQWRRVVEDDAWMTSHARDVIVCSEKLLEKKRDKSARVFLVKNGVDNLRYHPDQLNKLTIAEDIAPIPRPIAGYTGTLHDQRLDLGLIKETARSLSNVSFVFVGPNSLSSEQTKDLGAIANIHLLGAKSYAQLPQYIAGFDICMTPHLVSPFTESLDPLKLYEYMSTGKPIVSTACAGFRELEQLISVTANDSSFATAIEEAMQNDTSERRNERLKWASTCSWRERVVQVESVLGW